MNTFFVATIAFALGFFAAVYYERVTAVQHTAPIYKFGPQRCPVQA